MEAMRGMGVDRHLFGLYVVAKGMKMDPMPKMFDNKVSYHTVTVTDTSICPLSCTVCGLLFVIAGLQLPLLTVHLSDSSQDHKEMDIREVHNSRRLWHCL